MSSIISAGTSTGTALNLTGDTSGILQLASNNGTVGLTMDASQNLTYVGALTGGTGIVNLGSGQFYKDASGNVGIGTSSPSSALTIGAGGAARFNRADNATYNEIKYVTSGDQFYFNQQNNGNYTFNFGGTEKIRFTAAGDIVLAGGNTAANGVGITFPATQSASSDANTLDDYEEGTWTPNQGSGLVVVGTFSSTGTYTKIGNQVTVYVKFSGSTSIAVNSYSQVLSNLPFVTSGSNIYPTGSLITVTILPGSIINTGGPSTTTIFSTTGTSASTLMAFSITYQTN